MPDHMYPHEPGPLCNEECQPDLIENPVPLEELRAAALAPEEPESQLITDAFREGMSAGLDFAYRLIQDFRDVAVVPHRSTVDEILSLLVSEHEMRSDQPIRVIRAEVQTGQASDVALDNLRDILRVANETASDQGPTTMNLVEDNPTCDGPCCLPEADLDDVFGWVNVNPGHGLPEAQVNPRALEFGPANTNSIGVEFTDPNRCTCGRFWLNDPEGTVMAPAPGGAVRHQGTAPCYVAASYDDIDELS